MIFLNESSFSCPGEKMISKRTLCRERGDKSLLEEFFNSSEEIA